MSLLKMICLSMMGILISSDFTFAHSKMLSLLTRSSSDCLVDTEEYYKMEIQLLQTQSQLEELKKNHSELQEEFGCGLPPPPLPRGSFEVTGIRVGAEASYSCPDGYTLEGMDQAECGQTGTWGPGACCRKEISEDTSTDVVHLSVLDLTDAEAKEKLTSLSSFVEILNLFYNQLTRIPALTHIIQLDTLNELNLSFNKIQAFLWQEIPTSTTILFLDQNQLTDLPVIDDLDRCLKLTTLHVDYNKIETLKANMLPGTLKELYIDHNPLSTVGDLSHMSLRALDLSHSPLVGVDLEHLPVCLEELGGKLNDVSGLEAFVSLQKVVNDCDKFRAILPQNITCCKETLYFCLP